MPTLDFKGKQFVYAHHLTAPYRTLEIDSKKSLPPKGKSGKPDKPSLDDNLIVHGDNLHALKALLPRYGGKIKCIYIDPPYNTGNEGWCYNDNVNSPMMREWLKANSPVDGEDLERHDKWLCMMWPRLHLLKELLAEDGVIFVSIDDNEQHHLRMMMDEIFGEENFITNFIWTRKKKGSFLSKQIRKMTEFLVCYMKQENKFPFYGENAYSDKWQPIVKRTNSTKELEIPKNLVRTKLTDGSYDKGVRGDSETSIHFLNDFRVSNDIVTTKLRIRGRFVWSQKFLDEEIKHGTKITLSNQFGFNVLRHDQDKKIKAPSTLINQEVGVGTNEDATQEIAKIFNANIGEMFNYNKPYSLVKYLIKMITFNHLDAVVLDSFSGSGTTAHAVLALNNEDGGNRKFILVECEDYANRITAERVRRVIKGIPKAKDEKLKNGLGGSFTYCILGNEIDVENILTGESLPDYETLARYVAYTATGKSPDKIRKQRGKDGFFWEIETQIFYLIYQSNLKFLQSGESALNSERAMRIAKQAESRNKSALVFATHKFIGQNELTKMNIVFCQLPYQIYGTA